MSDFKQLLLTKGAEALKLEDEIAALKVLKETAEAWNQLDVELADIGSVEELMTTLAGDLESKPIADAFEKVGLKPLHTQLVAFLQTLKGTLGRVPDDLKTLLRPLSAFAAGEDGTVDWTLTGSTKPLDAKQYALDVSGEATIAFEAAAEGPEGVAEGRTLLKLGAKGEVKAAAKGTAPFSVLTAKGEVNASARTELGYYFDPSATPDALFGLAVAERLDALADPFDFDSVWETFRSSDIEAITYTLGGYASAKLDIGFADAQAISAGNILDVVFDIGVSASLKSDYSLTLSRVSATAGETAIRGVLTRGRVDESALSAGIGIEVDVSSITRPVAEALKRTLSVWSTLLEDIKPYLSPGTWLRQAFGDQLDAQLKALVENEALRAAVLADLKGAIGLAELDDLEVAKWLRGQVTDAIDRGRVMVDGKTAEATDRVLAVLGKALPAVMAQADPSARLKAFVKEQIDKVDGALRAKADALSRKPAADVKAALEKAGARVTGAVDTLDGALSAVRSLIARYDEIFKDIVAKAELAARSNVTASLYNSETRTSGLTVEAAGVFTAASPEASKVFEAITRGRLQTLVKVFEDQDGATPGFTLDREASSITRFSKLRRTQGWKIMFLDIALEWKALISNDARVTVDGQGNIRVVSKAALEKTFSGPFGEREVSFVDSFALVVAAKMKTHPDAGPPSLKAGIGASFSDDSLEWGQVKAFIEGLARTGPGMPGLVDPGASALARAVFKRWKSSGDISGEIAVALNLDGPAIEKLMQLQDRTAAGLGEAARLKIIRAGLKALDDRDAFDEAMFKAGAAIAAGEFLDSRKPAPTAMPELVLKHRYGLSDSRVAPIDEVPDINRGNVRHFVQVGAGLKQTQYVYFLRHAHALLKLVDLIDIMGAIYTSKPSADASGADGGWTREKYEGEQLKMVLASKHWLAVAKNLGSLLSPEITPRTTAFLQVMADLAGVNSAGPGGVTLTMTYRPGTGEPQTASFH